MAEQKSELTKLTQQDNQKNSITYTLISGALLAVIIITLGAMWYKERSKRIAFQVEARNAQIIYDKNRMLVAAMNGTSQSLAVLNKMVDAYGQKQASRIPREDWKRLDLDVIGTKTSVFEVTPKVAEQMGDFRDGDVIIVKYPPPAK